jgi:hypothetical protein
VPDSILNLSPNTTAAAATTTFDTVQDAWVTNLPSQFSGNGFLSAVSFNSGIQLPGGINPVKWQASFTASAPGVSLNWQWSAAVYTVFGSDPGVKPLDVKTSQYQTSDHAGTPENFAMFVTGGARGGGGSNFTGSYSATGKLTNIDTAQGGGISGTVFIDKNGDGLPDSSDIPVGTMVTLYNDQFEVVQTTTTNGSGFYSFTDVPPGEYTIVVVPPTGANGPTSITLTVEGGVTQTDVDFAFVFGG